MIQFHIDFTGEDGTSPIHKLTEVLRAVNAQHTRAFGYGQSVKANFDLESSEQVDTLKKEGFDPQLGYRGIVMM
jgi:hypothetical protein